MAALRACGISLDTGDQKPMKKRKRRHTHYSETLSDLINAGLLKPETKLHPFRKRLTETATVLTDGRLRVGTVAYETPSAAAKAVAGTDSEPGWDFWGAPSGAGGFVPLARLREKLRDTAAVPDVLSVDVAVGNATNATSSRDKAVVHAGHKSSPLAAIAKVRPDFFPLRIQATYRGHAIHAHVSAAGDVEYNGETYKTPSAAANAARRDHGFGGVTRVRTNGWTWWHFTDIDGSLKSLDALRDDRT
jgi:hypothetical protein